MLVYRSGSTGPAERGGNGRQFSSQERDLRLAQGLEFRESSRPEILVEADHEGRGGAIVDLPQARHHAPGSCHLGCPLETEESFPSRGRPQARLAGGEDEELGTGQIEGCKFQCGENAVLDIPFPASRAERVPSGAKNPWVARWM